MSKITSPKPVEWVVSAGLNELKSLIEQQNYDPKQKGISGRTLLHCACIGGQLDMVKYLIEKHQLNPLSKDADDKTPLYWAVKIGHVDIIEYLMGEQSVDPGYA